MAEVEIPSIFDLDWFGDLTMYQHPPCMFALWYLVLGGKYLYEVIDALIKGDSGGSDGGGGGGAEDSGKKEKEGDKKEESPPPAGEEAPPEEGG